MISYVDTEELEAISGEILTAAGDLEIEIKALFNRLNNVPQGTQEWIGKQANYYFSVVAQDEKNYLDYVNKIKALGHELRREAESIGLALRGEKHE